MLSVVVPAKDEPYLPTLLNHLSILGYTDVKVQTEKGYSKAVLNGIHNTTGETIAIMDADGSHNPAALPSMEYLANYYDIVVGSRYTQFGSTSDTRTRQAISRLYCQLAKALFNLELSDPLSGFIVAKRSVYDNIALKPIGYKFGLELLVKANGKYKITEYPIDFAQRKAGHSKAGFSQGIKTLFFMLKLYMEKKFSDKKDKENSVWSKPVCSYDLKLEL